MSKAGKAAASAGRHLRGAFAPFSGTRSLPRVLLCHLDPSFSWPRDQSQSSAPRAEERGTIVAPLPRPPSSAISAVPSHTIFDLSAADLSAQRRSSPSRFFSARSAGFSTEAAASGGVVSPASSSDASAAVSNSATSSATVPTVPELDALFRGKASPLGSGPNPTVAIAPAPGFSGMLLGALGYYGKESRLIRGARALYSECTRRADEEAFLSALGLEKCFRASHAVLVLHTWMVLVRLRAEAETEVQKRDAAEVGQTMYDLFNHDCEKRVVAAGVTMLVSKWMKELEKNFYGACIAYDNALKPEAGKDALESALWRNVIQDGERFGDLADPVAAAASRALDRYVRLQLASLALTGSEAFITGNIMFTPAQAK